MKIEYMRTAKKSYMIVREADYPFEPYELKMILRNTISCLLPFQTILTDGKAAYWYEVSGMQSLKTRFLLESVDGKQLRILLENLMEMQTAMEEYLLDDTNICFLPDMIWFDRSAERVRFCYIPGLGSSNPAFGMAGVGGQRGTGLRALFEEMLQHINHADPAAVRMGYEMYERAARAPFGMQDCLDCLRIGEHAAKKAPDASIAERDIRWSDETADRPDPGTGPESEGADDVEFLFEEPEPKAGHSRKRKDREKRRKHPRGKDLVEEELLFALRPLPSEQPEDPGGSAEDLNRTELIREEDVPKTWELVYKGDGLEQDLSLTAFPYLVGTDARRVNGVLRARTVSRLHAKLYLEEGRLFVEDFNSTNGTYLNHDLLALNTPAELREGDRIVFGTEEYAVYCRRAGSAGGSQR